MLRVVSIAAVLGALVTLAAEHRTQAQNVPGVIFADAFAPNPSTKSEEDQRDFGYVEAKYIGENSAGKISSVAGSGGRRCEMSPEEFAKYYPPLLDWIQTTLTASAHVAQTIASRGFSRLPLYFTEKTLASLMTAASLHALAKDERPVPPLPIDARQAAARDHARSLSELADTAARDSARCQSSGAALGSQAYKECRALLESKMSIEKDVTLPPTALTLTLFVFCLLFECGPIQIKIIKQS